MLNNTTQRALLIDFAGTLFLPLGGQQWATAAARKASAHLTCHDSLRLAALLDSRFHHVRDPGRDLSPAAHRQSMLPVLESLTADKALASSLYDLQYTDGFWRRRHGAPGLLRAARQRGMRIIAVSNVAWDIRPLFPAGRPGRPDQRVRPLVRGRRGEIRQADLQTRPRPRRLRAAIGLYFFKESFA